MSNFRKLAQLLEKELEFQDKILLLLVKERAAIAKLDQIQIDALKLEKQKLLLEAEKVEKKRSEIIAEIQAESKDPVKLKDIVELCPAEDIKDRLSRVGDGLKATTTSVTELNSANSALIKQSLGIIASTISIIRSAPGSDLPTYGKAGKLSSETQDPAFAKGRRGSVSREV